MRLIHFSREPLGEVYSVDQTENAYRGDKPAGLWVSVEGPQDWPAWCQDEGFGVGNLWEAAEIILKPDARILHIGSVEELSAFDRDYGYCPFEEMAFIRWVNWPRMSEWHQGIIIAPYISQALRHREIGWYHTWDCASGCIWDKDAIAQVNRMPGYRPAVRAVG